MKLVSLLCCCLIVSLAFPQQPQLVLPVGNTSSVYFALFSPDGKKMVTLNGDSTATIWDTRTGLVLKSLTGHTDKINGLAFSPDGNSLISISDDNTGRLWDMRYGKLRKVLKGHTKHVTKVLFSPDGKKALTYANNGEVYAWDPLTGVSFYRFNVIDKQPDTTLIDGIPTTIGFSTMLKFSPDGTHIITSNSKDGYMKIWNATTGVLTFVFKNKAFEKSPTFFCVSSDSKRIAVITADEPKTIQVWNIEDQSLAYTVECVRPFIYGTIFKAGEKIHFQANVRDAPAYIDRMVGDEIEKIKEYADGRMSFHTSTDRKKEIDNIFSGVSSRKIYTLKEDGSRTLLTNLDNHENNIIQYCEFSPDGNKVVTIYKNNEVLIWDLITNTRVKLQDKSFSIKYASFSNKPEIVVNDSEDGWLRYWNWRYARLNTVVRGQLSKNHISFLHYDFTRDGTKLFTAYENQIYGYRSAVISDTKSGKPIVNLDIHDVIKSTFSGNNTILAVVIHDGGYGVSIKTTYAEDKIQIWNVVTGKRLSSFHAHTDKINGLCLNYSGTVLLSASDDKTAKAWNTQTGSLLFVAARHKNRVNSVCFSPNETEILTASRDGTVMQCKAGNGNPIRLLETGGNAEEAHYSADGQKIAAIGNSSIKIWRSDGLPLTGNISFKGHFLDIDSNFDAFMIKRGPALEMAEVQTGKILGSFIAIDSINYWVQIPSGYYRCTPGTTRQLHCVSADLKIINVEQFDIKYNRPDIVLAAMGCPDKRLIEVYRQAYLARIRKLHVDTTQFTEKFSLPEANILNREQIGPDVYTRKLSLNIACHDEKYKLDRYNVYVNGVPVFGSLGKSLQGKHVNKFTTTLTIDLSRGSNRIEVSASNSTGVSSYRNPLYVNYSSLN